MVLEKLHMIRKHGCEKYSCGVLLKMYVQYYNMAKL